MIVRLEYMNGWRWARQPMSGAGGREDTDRKVGHQQGVTKTGKEGGVVEIAIITIGIG